MRNRLPTLVLVLVFFFSLSVLTAPAPPFAQGPARQGVGRVDYSAVRKANTFDVHDLSGIFRSVAGGLEVIGPDRPPMTPAGEAKFKTRTSADRVNNFKDNNDPQFGCNPQGFPRLWLDQELIENIHLDGRILQLTQWEQTLREIWMDGRELPSGETLARLGPTFYGYSVGKWEGDTLIVETTGFDERNWLDDDYGYPLSFDARIEERYRKVGPDVISVQYVLYDPKNYTAPWVGEIKPWRRMPREITTHFGWFGLFSGVTEAICAPVNEEEYHKGNRSIYEGISGAR